MRDSARFVLDFLLLADDGTLLFGPAGSPESSCLNDNGEGVHRSNCHDPSGGWRRSIGHVWEGCRRVPQVVRPPGKSGPGRVGARLVSHVDIPQTVAAIAGVPLPAGAAPDAVGFAGAVVEDAPGEGPRDRLVLHSEAGMFALRAGGWTRFEGTEGSGNWPPPAGSPRVPGGPVQLYDSRWTSASRGTSSRLASTPWPGSSRCSTPSGRARGRRRDAPPSGPEGGSCNRSRSTSS